MEIRTLRAEKRRAGLDVDMRLWIILDEYNTDIIGRSFYLESEPPIGRVWMPPTLQGISSDFFCSTRFYRSCVRPLIAACATGPVCSSKNRVHIGSESFVLEPRDWFSPS